MQCKTLIQYKMQCNKRCKIMKDIHKTRYHTLQDMLSYTRYLVTQDSMQYNTHICLAIHT